MNTLQICLFIFGLIVFVGSFFITEKLSSSDTEMISRLSEKEVKSLVEKELSKASEQMDRLLTEKSEEAVEKIEVSTDKDTNEKLMSIGEYSDTILKAMNDSHDEIMFIYQILNEKQENITNMVSEIGKQESALRNMKASIEDKLKELEEKEVALKQQESKVEEAQKLHFKEDVRSLKEAFIEKMDQVEEIKKEKSAIESLQASQNEKKTTVPLDSSKDELKKKIVSMHQEGFSEVEIAKKCGVGIGEIKLILGLFDEV
jgi:prophage DNA circulation protein